MRLHKHSLILFFLLLPFFLKAGLIDVEICDLQVDTINLLNQSQYFIDESNQLKVEDVIDESFIDSENGYRVLPGKNYWARFLVSNHTEDTLRPLLIDRVSYASLYLKTENRFTFLGNTGSASPEKDIIESSHCIELIIEPGERKEYYFRMENFLSNRKVKLLLIFPDNMPGFAGEYNDNAKVRQSGHNVLMGILLFICFISAIQYLVSKIPPFKYYAFYLLACLLMYLKYLDWLFEYAGAYEADLYYAVYQIESIAAYLMTIGYVLFVQHFLRLDKNAPKVNILLKYVVNAHIALIAIDLLLRWWFDYRVAFGIFTYTRLFTFPIVVGLIVFFLFNLKEKLYRFVVVGTLLFMLPMLRTLVKHVIPSNHIANGYFYSCESYFGVNICLYNSRAGLLLEMICFFIGLGYLLKKESDEKNKFEKLAIESNKRLAALRQNSENGSDKELKTENSNILPLPSRNGYDVINANQILYCTADGNACCIYLKNGKKNLVYKTLKEINSMLPSSDFIRIHASHTVNLNSIVRYIRGEGGIVVLTNNEELKVSRSRKEELLTRLNIA